MATQIDREGFWNISVSLPIGIEDPFNQIWGKQRRERAEAFDRRADLDRHPCRCCKFAPACDNRRVLCGPDPRSEEHTSELQSHHDLVCRLLLEKKKKKKKKSKTNKKQNTT